MTSVLERRIEALEEQLEKQEGPRKGRVALLFRNADGSWPPNPPEASRVIRIVFVKPDPDRFPAWWAANTPSA